MGTQQPTSADKETEAAFTNGDAKGMSFSELTVHMPRGMALSEDGQSLIVPNQESLPDKVKEAIAEHKASLINWLKTYTMWKPKVQTSHTAMNPDVLLYQLRELNAWPVVKGERVVVPGAWRLNDEQRQAFQEHKALLYRYLKPVVREIKDPHPESTIGERVQAVEQALAKLNAIISADAQNLRTESAERKQAEWELDHARGSLEVTLGRANGWVDQLRVDKFKHPEITTQLFTVAEDELNKMLDKQICTRGGPPADPAQAVFLSPRNYMEYLENRARHVEPAKLPPRPPEPPKETDEEAF